MVCHPVSPCPKICAGSDNNTSASQREKAGKESWHVARKELQASAAPGSRFKWKQPLSDPDTEAGASGAEDGGMLYQQSEPETMKTVRPHLPPSDAITRQENGCDAHSLTLMRDVVGEEDVLIADSEHITDPGTRQVSNIGHEIQSAVNEATRKARGNRDVSVPALPLKTSEDVEAKRHLNSLDITDSIVDSGTGGETCEEDEENYLKYRVSTSEVKKAEHPANTKKATTAENPQKIPMFSESGQHDVSRCSAENPQDKGQTETDTAEEDHTQELPVQSEASRLGLGDNSDENLEKTDVLEVRVEDKPGNKTSHHQMVVGQCNTNDGEVSEFPRMDTEEEERRGEDREAQEVPPVDIDVKNKSEGKCG